MKKNNLTKFMYGIFLILLSIPFFTSCLDENDTELPFLEVSSNIITFDVNGNPIGDGLNYFEISTNRPWRISVPEDKSWVTLSSTSGEGPAKITVSVPENINDKAEIKVEIINKIGVILSETISIISGDITPATLIYYENFGPNGDKVNDKWLYVDQYKEWAKTGEGAASVTYDGSSASIRNSGKLSAGYEGASGNAKLFFSSDAYFVVNNITLKENQRNLNLSFGGSYSLRKDDGTYDNEFKLDKFTVKLSADGKTWSDNLALTMKKGDEYWNLLSSDFTLPNPISSLYIKFISGEASVFSIDDVKLTTGKGGNIINLEGSGENPEEPSEAKAITIPEINAMMTAEGAVVDADSDRYFEAVVQNDTLGKNFSAINLFVATENSKDASNGITLYGSQVNIYTLNLNKGDKVKVTLKKGLAKAQNYNGMYELTGDKEADWVSVEKLQGKATITPVVITPDKLSSYQGMTVSIESATPAKAGTWEGGKTQTFNASGKDFNVYCNKSAVFAGEQYIEATGIISGIVTVYKNNAQMLPRDAVDVKAFSGTTPPPSSGNEIALTKDNIVSGKTGSVELISNGYGKQDVADESTWYTFKNGDYNFTGARIGLGPDKNGGGIQVQGNASDIKKQGFIHNVSEIKEIQSIEIVLKVAKTSDYDPSYSVYVGDKVNPNSENTTLTASIEKTEEGDFRVYKDTYDVSSKGKFNFLSIKNDKAGVLYIQTITIKYKGE